MTNITFFLEKIVVKFQVLLHECVHVMYDIQNFQISHYANMSVQYTAIFHGCKNGNFQMKNRDIFLIFAQNTDCGYTLEPPR